MNFEKEYEVKDIEELSPYNIYFYLRELTDKWEVLALRTVNGWNKFAELEVASTETQVGRKRVKQNYTSTGYWMRIWKSYNETEKLRSKFGSSNIVIIVIGILASWEENEYPKK